MEAGKAILDSLSGKGGSTMLLVGSEGSGKNELVSYATRNLERRGFKFLRGSSFIRTELSRYHIFNQILNDAKQEFRNRDVEELMSSFNSLVQENNSGKTVIVTEGLDNASEESMDFFIFLSRLTAKHNFKLLGTFTTGGGSRSREQGKFLRLVEMEESLNTLHLEKMNVHDFRFYLADAGYNLPDRFVNDLFRLVDGNMNMLKYTLTYYREHGIINEKGEVDDVVYRFFPIPQGMEIHYSRIFSELGEKQVFVAQLLCLLHEETSYQTLSLLSGIDETRMLSILSRLVDDGIAVEHNLKYDISNYRMQEFILKNISNTRKLEIYSVLSGSDLFTSLPLQMQLNIHLEREEFDTIGDILIQKGNSVLSDFSSITAVKEFLEEYLEKTDDSTFRVVAKYTRCRAIELLNGPEDAAACYLDLLADYPDQTPASISLARVMGDQGKYEEALDILNGIGPVEDISDSEIGLLYLAKGTIFRKKREYVRAEETLRLAIDIFRRTGNREKEASAMNVLGTVLIETFRHNDAMSYFRDALDINRSLNLVSYASKNLNNIAIVLLYNGEFESAIKILNELIEASYIAGDVLTRAYATYNLAESYYIVGKMDEVRSNIPSAIKLVAMANRKDLTYKFYRFLSLLYMNDLQISDAHDAIEKAIEAVENEKGEQMYRIAYAMKEYYAELMEGKRNEKLPGLFLERTPEDEEFLPLFKALGATMFTSRGDIANARKIVDESLDRAMVMGERYGILSAYLNKAMVLFYGGYMDELAEFLEKCPEPTTGALKYDSIMDLLMLCARAPGMDRIEFEEKLGELRERPGDYDYIDLIYLYRETILYLTRKRFFGVEEDLTRLMGNIPKNFKYAFHVFAENNSII